MTKIFFFVGFITGIFFLKLIKLKRMKEKKEQGNDV